MEKLQYDSLYKFFVSLGVILIASPIAILLLLFKSEFLTISQQEFDNLSKYTLSQISRKELYFQYIDKYLPWFAVLVIIIGVALIILGIKEWYKIQKLLDKHIENDTKIAEQKYIQMTNSEVFQKANNEYNETLENEIDTNNKIIEDPRIKYINIEDRYFDYLSSSLSTHTKRNIIFKRNVKIGSFCYDYIFISKTNNIDTIYEIKYWNHTISTALIKRTIQFLKTAGENYQKETNRDYIFKLIIISNKKMLNSIRNATNSIIYNENTEFELQNIQIEYVDESSI